MNKSIKKLDIIARLRGKAADSLRAKRIEDNECDISRFRRGLLFGEYLGYKYAAENVASKLNCRLLVDNESGNYETIYGAAHIDLPTAPQSTAEKEAEGRFFSARPNRHDD